MNHNLALGKVELAHANLTIDKVVNERGSHVPEQSPNLRFLFSVSPYSLSTNDQMKFVAERSAVKVHPETPIELEAASGTVIYVISFSKGEAQYLEELKTDSFFNSLRGRDSKEWEEVKDKGLDYVISGERNAEHIIQLPDIVIAPPHSRHNAMIGNGWHLMYARASRAVGVGSDVLFRVREEEQAHAHKILHEVYICLDGALELSIEGEDVALTRDHVICISHGSMHAMNRITSKPYNGLTLQTPSIPGDKVF